MTVQEDQSYYIRGDGVGVLLIHDLAGTPAEMRYVANGMARAGYSAYCPQLAGHCGTEEDLRATRWQDWYASAERAYAELKQDCDTIVVGGLSTGAVLALLLAARNPKDVQGVALYSPLLWLNGRQVPWRTRLFRAIPHKPIANMFNLPDVEPHGIKDDRVREFVRTALASGDSSAAGLSSTPGGAVIEHNWLAQVVCNELKGIQQPALIVHPREDDYADLNNAWYLQRNLSGIVDMVVLDDSYHIVTIDRQRHIVVERTVALIESITKRSKERRAKPATQGMADAPQTITVKATAV